MRTHASYGWQFMEKRTLCGLKPRGDKLHNIALSSKEVKSRRGAALPVEVDCPDCQQVIKELYWGATLTSARKAAAKFRQARKDGMAWG